MFCTAHAISPSRKPSATEAPEHSGHEPLHSDRPHPNGDSGGHFPEAGAEAVPRHSQRVSLAGYQRPSRTDTLEWNLFAVPEVVKVGAYGEAGLPVRAEWQSASQVHTWQSRDVPAACQNAN